MRNKEKSKAEYLLERVEKLPYFSFDNLRPFGLSDGYRRILLSRLVKNGKVIRLKKSFYVSKSYLYEVERRQEVSGFIKFLSNVIYEPSYLSLEYVLSEYGILTDSPHAITLVTTKKTQRFSHSLGIFLYRSIREHLFIGFYTRKYGKFRVKEATKAKALFDFLYFRKILLENREALLELRLNLECITQKDRKEFKKYIDLEGSKKMKIIFEWLFF